MTKPNTVLLPFSGDGPAYQHMELTPTTSPRHSSLQTYQMACQLPIEYRSWVGRASDWLKQNRRISLLPSKQRFTEIARMRLLTWQINWRLSQVAGFKCAFDGGAFKCKHVDLIPFLHALAELYFHKVDISGDELWNGFIRPSRRVQHQHVRRQNHGSQSK